MIFKIFINGLTIKKNNINYYIKLQGMALPQLTFIQNVIIKDLPFVLLDLKTITKSSVVIHQFNGTNHKIIKHQMIILYSQLLMLKDL
jgi:hypothetical protein